MAVGLHEQEQAVQGQRNRGDEEQLGGGIHRPRDGPGVVGKYQRQRGQGADHTQRTGGALYLEALFVVAYSPGEQAQADDAVEHNHHGGEHRIPGDFTDTVGAGKHHGHDKCDLYDRHGPCQYQ